MNKSLTLTLTMPAELKKRIERESKIPERSVPAWDSLERVSQAGRAKSFLCPPFPDISASNQSAMKRIRFAHRLFYLYIFQNLKSVTMRSDKCWMLT